MNLEVLKCPSCGANIEFDESVESCECEYCGAKVTKISAQNINRNISSVLNNDYSSPAETNKVNLKKVKSSVDKSMRKGIIFCFNALFIASLLFGGICMIIAITDADVSMVFFGLFCLVYAAMFKVLALTPKGSKHILGKEKGIKPVYFVLICVLVSFMMVMLSPTTEDTTNANSDTSTISETVIEN